MKSTPTAPEVIVLFLKVLTKELIYRLKGDTLDNETLSYEESIAVRKVMNDRNIFEMRRHMREDFNDKESFDTLVNIVVPRLLQKDRKMWKKILEIIPEENSCRIRRGLVEIMQRLERQKT